MQTINATFTQEPGLLGVLGRADENGARQIVFDCSEVVSEYPDAQFVCAVKREFDIEAYEATITRDGNNITLVLTDVETFIAGTVRIELRAMSGDTLLKSAVYIGEILPSLRGQDDKPENPIPDVLNRIDTTLAEATATRDDLVKALDGVDTAVAKAETAADTADAATLAANTAEEKRAAAETQRESDFKAAITASGTAQGNAQAAAENANTAAQNANLATSRADAAEEKRTAAETKRENAETARVSAENARATAETERVANEERRQAALTEAVTKAQTAQAGAETAKASAETAATAAATYAENSAAEAADAGTSADNAALSATAAAGSASEAASTKTEVTEMLGVIAHENTAQQLLAKYEEGVTLLRKIIDEGTGGGSLNGFSFSVGENNEWVLTYQNPEDETDIQTYIMPTETTGAKLADVMASTNDYLKQMAEGGSSNA